ncbi:Kunitz/Bovine pancreatic trypsin inhibitor domain protein [Oesophagostomum dentatum]|uniref:Kunitz/Bovine pancreatic trypsin inhibitor domain protein n=1 Tax=Oesophagostomum dentatum TaxID=61180 RepID=A0A0B1RUR3_OESDE|nr:Kunitz/Bovine pancreatic trypsin inhibitor domain protein [Oesophagostomum dentatum]
MSNLELCRNISQHEYQLPRYYETVQCDANGCFCVAAHNGFIAYDTRTDSNKVAPKCSNCHNALKRIFAKGDPPSDTFIPRCDMSMGNYEPLQCDAKQEYCFCVNTITGKQIPNTRKRKEKNRRIKCDNIGKFSLDSTQLQKIEGGEPQERYPVGRETCKLDRHRGNACRGAKPSIRYFFDYRTFACLAFEYLGCGGNENRYRTSSECSFDCKLRKILIVSFQPQSSRSHS